MPNRIVREGILDSYAVNALDDSAEIFYRRLMSIVDDYGRIHADPRLLLGRLFALQMDRWDVARVEKCIADVTQVRSIRVADDTQTNFEPLVTAYEVKGKKYLQINNFGQTIRVKKMKFPEPDKQMLSTCVADAQHVRSTCVSESNPNPIRLGLGIESNPDPDVNPNPHGAFLKSKVIDSGKSEAENYRCERCGSRSRGEGAILKNGKITPCSCASDEWIQRQIERGLMPKPEKSVA